jgi:hypothetical protein
MAAKIPIGESLAPYAGAAAFLIFVGAPRRRGLRRAKPFRAAFWTKAKIRREKRVILKPVPGD